MDPHPNPGFAASIASGHAASPAPKASVIVAVHDVAAHVAEAIASLRAQTLKDFEALVIDDGATDGSGAVALQAIGADPRFRLIWQDNRGLGAARNTGLALARGEWLAFLDGDDALEPAFLQSLITAAEGAGQPWAMGALRFWTGQGAGVAHSGLHGSPDPAGMVPRVLTLTDALQVARLFPSAWGKVMHRSLFAGLRFPEGCWFEDHEPFWQLAARSRAILHVPQPLYRHRRDRPGQITGADDDRAFDQFAVLDRLMPLINGFDHAQEGATRLASRLIHERAAVLHAPARRERFLATAREWFATLGLTYQPATHERGDQATGLALDHALKGETVCSLTGPGLAGKDPSSWRPAAAALGETGGLAEMAELARRMQGRYLLFVPDGTTPQGAAPERLLDAALSSGAELVLGQLETAQGHHDGWMDNRLVTPAPAALPPGGAPLTLSPEAALRLHPSPGRMLIGAALLARIGPLSVPLGHPLAGAELVLRAGLAARHVLVVPVAVARATPPAVTADQALSWAANLELPEAPPLPPGWRSILALRAMGPRLPPARSLGGITARLALAQRLRRHGLRAPAGAAPADPGTDRILAKLAGLPLSRG